MEAVGISSSAGLEESIAPLQLLSISDLEQMDSGDSIPSSVAPPRFTLPESILLPGIRNSGKMPPDLKAVTVQTKALTQAEEDSSANSPNEVTDLNSKTTVSRSSSYSKYGNTIFSSNRCGLEPLAANTVIQKLERIVNEVIGIGQLNVTSTDGAGDSHILSYIVQLAACARSALILSEVKRHALENEIEKDVSDALKQLFGFWLSKFVHIHGRVDLSGGLLPSEDVQVYRTALFMATLSGRGSKSVPVLYFPKNAASLNIIGRLKSCWSLIGGPVGVSTAIFRCVPISKIGETIDITSLLTFMDEDISHGRRPCLLFCNAGTPQAGQVDELRKLREICDQYNCWMHVEGDQLYALMTSTLSRSSSIRPVHSLIDAARLADSVTVNLNGAFALSGNVLPAITFFQNIDPRQEDPLLAFEFQEFPEPHSHLSSTNLDKAIAPLRHPTTSLELTLPLWVTLSNETNKLKVFYAKARELAQAMASRSLMIPCLTSISDADTVYFASCVRFSPNLTHPETRTTDNFLDKDESSEVSDITLSQEISSNLGTRHLFEALPSEIADGLALDLTTINSYLYIRYMPLRSALGLESQAELLVSAMTFFENQAKISESTLRLQPLFKSIVENGPKELTFVEDFVPITENENSSTTRILATRLSLGALRYTPSFIDLTTENLSEEVLLDLDKLNNRLAEKLAEVYDASLFYRAQELFSDEVVANGAEDQARSPRSCIGIGLDRSVFTRERVKNLVDNISRYGREMETSHEFVENISAVVRRGIEQAEMELKSEMSDDVHVFRTLPVIGTVLSIIGVPRPSKSPQRMRPHGPVARTFTISSGFSTVPLAGAPQPGRMSISLTHDNLSESPRLPERRASDGQVLSTGIQFLPEVEPSGIQEPAIV